MNADNFEERTGEILGQIQASVAEYVRTMNEAGALRRREADEAHRQHDKAIEALKAIEQSGKNLLDSHATFAARAGNEWLGLVERGFRDTATAQAREAVTTLLERFECQTESLMTRLEKSTEAAGKVVLENERVCKALAWKTIGMSALWLLVGGVIMKFLFD